MPPAPSAVVEQCYERFANDELPWDLLAEDIVWDVPMVDAGGEGFHGHAGVADFFRRWIGTWEDYSFGVEETRELPDGRILSLFWERGRGKGSGAQVELRPAGIWTVTDGKVVHYRGYLDRDEAMRDAGLA
jgi:ketosteroid isomerase-like protein